MPDNEPPQSSIVLYQTEDGRTRIQCRFENETIWLTQALIAELFQKDVRTVNEHLVNIFEESELSREATIRKFRMVRREGTREVTRDVEHYSLDAILAVGYRVSSHRGTQFRQWATARLSEYLVKGFTMDDEWLLRSGNSRGDAEDAETKKRVCRQECRSARLGVNDPPTR
ncbi:MAG: RhuM family protein, partial [Deltaproteobacteria bacterium]|nr:RhuM family protein [Deltaproteobacteria bacterium]